MVLPWASVIVIIVLLKLAFTCATPQVMFLRSRRRRRGVVVLAIIDPAFGAGRCLFLLAGDRPRLALAGARVGMRALTMHRQALAVAQAPVAAEVHEPLDVHRHLAAQVAFDPVVAVDHLADAHDLVFGELIDPPRFRDTDLFADLPGFRPADPMDIAEADQRPLLRGDIDAGYTGHRTHSSGFIGTHKDARSPRQSRGGAL